MYTLLPPDLAGCGLLDPGETWAVIAIQMTEQLFAQPGVREDFERWLAEREAKETKQSAPAAANRGSAVPGAAGETAPERVIGDNIIIAQRKGGCKP